MALSVDVDFSYSFFNFRPLSYWFCCYFYCCAFELNERERMHRPNRHQRRHRLWHHYKHGPSIEMTLLKLQDKRNVRECCEAYWCWVLNRDAIHTHIHIQKREQQSMKENENEISNMRYRFLCTPVGYHQRHSSLIWFVFVFLCFLLTVVRLSFFFSLVLSLGVSLFPIIIVSIIVLGCRLRFFPFCMRLQPKKAFSQS